MWKYKVGGIFLIAFIVIGNVVSADPVTYIGSQSQTVDGQNFTFTETGVAAAASGATAMFVVEARGD